MLDSDVNIHLENIREQLKQIVKQFQRQQEVNLAMEEWCEHTEVRLNALEQQAGAVKHV